MKIWGASEADIREAARLAGVAIFSDYSRSGVFRDGRALRCRLALGSERQEYAGERTESGRKIKPPLKWQRRSTSPFHSERRVSAVCWHGHFRFMSALYALAGDNVRIQTAFADYRSREDFYDKAPETGYRNIGSQVFPTQAREACYCGDYEDDYGSVYDLGGIVRGSLDFGIVRSGADV